MWDGCAAENKTSHVWRSHVTRMNESCHTQEWVMSHAWMSNATCMNESCHTHWWVMSHAGQQSCLPQEGAMSHTRISHVARMNDSCHTQEVCISYARMSHVTRKNKSCHAVRMSHVTRMNASCRTQGLELDKSNIETVRGFVQVRLFKKKKIYCIVITSGNLVASWLYESLLGFVQISLFPLKMKYFRYPPNRETWNPSIAGYKFKLRFWFHLNWYRGMWDSGCGGLWGCSSFSGKCHRPSHKGILIKAACHSKCSLMYLECHFLNLKSQSMIYVSFATFSRNEIGDWR